MKKKLVLAILLISMFICGCGKNVDVASTESPNAANQNDVTSDIQTKDQTQEEPDSSNGAVTVDEQVIFDQDNIKITVTGFDPDGSFIGCELTLLVENNSDKCITVQARNVSVNGYMVDTSMSAEVMPGKKDNTALTISSSSLEECNIEKIANIEFCFHIFDSESWDTFIDSDTIVIKTSCFDTYTQSYDDNGELIYEDEEIRIISKGIKSDGFLGPELVLYIENNSTKNLTIQARDTSINGFMVSPAFSAEVVNGKKILSSITFLSSEIEENNIADFENIETSFHIFEMENWESSKDTDVIVIDFK